MKKEAEKAEKKKAKEEEKKKKVKEEAGDDGFYAGFTEAMIKTEAEAEKSALPAWEPVSYPPIFKSSFSELPTPVETGIKRGLSKLTSFVLWSGKRKPFCWLMKTNIYKIKCFLLSEGKICTNPAGYKYPDPHSWKYVG